MKKRYVITMSLWLFLGYMAFAQSTEILPGLVLPQMTTAQRTAMVNPDNGSLVFDKTTQSYWYRQNGVWAELPEAGSTSNYWKLAGIEGNEIQNTNSGGFWSKNTVAISSSATNITNPPTVPIDEAGTRLMWIPGRSAFRAGTVNVAAKWSADSIGLFSFAAGSNVTARGKGTIALGSATSAIGDYSTALGGGAIAKGDLSTSIGFYSVATGFASIALNHNSEASGETSLASGYKTIAGGFYSTAMGIYSQATGNSSTALNRGTKAIALNTLATGFETTASGESATAMGSQTKASGKFSTSLGVITEAIGEASIALNSSTIASGLSSLASGNATTASGDYTTAMGSKVNTNNKKGAFIIGDSDPDNEGLTGSGVADQLVARFKNGYYLMTSGNANPRTGVMIANGQTAWSAISDSTRKERFLKADGETFLTKLRELRMGSWNYKGQKSSKPERFYGPMAQEIFAAFGKDSYGTIGTDTTVSTINMDGLLFIFSQALEKRTTDLQTENQQLKTEMLEMREEARTLKSLIQQLDARLASIEMQDTKASPQSSKMKVSLAKKDLPDRQEVVTDK